jgi:hypothetical protein
MKLRRRTRRKIDRQGSLIVFLDSNTQATKGKPMNDQDEPDDEFRMLDEVNEEDRPLPTPVTRALTHGQRVQLLAWRYENGLALFHPAER